MDYDILLWAISQINEAVNAGLATSPRIALAKAAPAAPLQGMKHLLSAIVVLLLATPAAALGGAPVSDPF